MIVRNFILAGLILILAACNPGSSNGFTTVKVKEVEQVGMYTYLLVKGKGPEYWVAVPSMNASPGETYQYQGGLVMEEFYSEELDRTFDRVLFLEGLYPEAGSSEKEGASQNSPEEFSYESMVTIEKSDVKVETAEGAITIAELFSDPGAYSGKTIHVTGEVTKFNAAIMERNWVHIQDGTEFEGKFDLTATSSETFVVGTRVTLEGILTLDHDFGYGYTYDVLLEKATAVTPQGRSK